MTQETSFDTQTNSAQLNCRATRAWVQSFAGGDRTRPDDAVARTHLARCADCTTAYRTAVETASRIGRVRRAERDENERATRRARFRRMCFEGQSPERGWVNRVRLMLIPSFFVFLIVYATQTELPSVRAFECRLVQGQAMAGELHLTESDQAGELRSGEWCFTAAGAQAEVSLATSMLELGGDTRLFVQGGNPDRVYLEQGELRATGDIVIVQPTGVLTLMAATVTLRGDSRSMRVHVERGSAEWSDADGVQTLVPGAVLLRSKTP